MANDRKNYDDLLGNFEPKQKKPQRRTVTPPTGEFNMFENSPRKIYVPSGSEDAYRSAEAWMYYADYIVGYNF